MSLFICGVEVSGKLAEVDPNLLYECMLNLIFWLSFPSHVRRQFPNNINVGLGLLYYLI